MKYIFKVILIVCSCLFVFATVACIRGWFAGKAEQVSVAPGPDLLKHPIYGKYTFGETLLFHYSPQT